jgi:hypothetical protein
MHAPVVEMQQYRRLLLLLLLAVLVDEGMHPYAAPPDIHVHKATEVRECELLGGDELGAVAHLEVELQKRLCVDPGLEEMEGDCQRDGSGGGV